VIDAVQSAILDAPLIGWEQRFTRTPSDSVR
jgi:hypothetical protein